MSQQPLGPSHTGWGRRVRAALALVALAEIATIILVGGLLGTVPTVVLLLVSSAAGVWVLRRLSRRALRDLAPPDGTIGRVPQPDADIADTATLAGAGLLLAVPGLLTGAVGALLVLPPVRRGLRPVLARAVAPLAERLLRAAGMGQVVEGEVVPPGPASQVRIEVVEVRDPEPPSPPRELPPDPDRPGNGAGRPGDDAPRDGGTR